MADAGCVVVGGGLAGAKVVETLREEGYAGPVTLISEESVRPYERPPLSKDYLQGAKPFEDAYVHPEQWYAEHDVDLRLGERAESIDRDAREVVLASGERVPYAYLVLATGSIPRTLSLPGTKLAGVHTLRTVTDSDALRAAFADIERVAIIGAGWIGLEVAAAARAAGLEVTVLEAAPYPLHRVLGDRIAQYFADLHTRNGVDLRAGVTVSAIIGAEGRVTGVQTDSGLVEADLVLIGVGAVPDTALAEAAGLPVDDGVVVDSRLRTTDPAVLAAGDVASAYHEALGRHLRVEHWDNAIRHGELAAKTILGREDVYDWQPYFFTDQFDLGMEYVGHASLEDDVVVRGELDSGEFIVFWLGDGVVRAAMNVNIWDVSDDLRALIGRSIDPARLSDPGVTLADL